MLIGGGLADDNAEIYNAFFDLATPAQGKQRIGIITAASADAVINGEFYVDLFTKTYNVDQAEWIPIYSDNPDAAYD